MNNFKNKTIHTLYIFFAAVFLWVAVSNMIQAFKCPKMSQTELFLHIPKSFLCDWECCNGLSMN